MQGGRVTSGLRHHRCDTTMQSNFVHGHDDRRRADPVNSPFTLNKRFVIRVSAVIARPSHDSSDGKQ
jgi:hypothetical protein